MKLNTYIRPGDLEEIEQIRRTHHADFDPINLDHCLTHAFVEDNNKIIAYGIVNIFPEAILILDKSAAHRDQVQAWRMLMIKAINDTREKGHEFLRAVVHDDAYFNLLHKHYGFKESIGKHIYMEL